MAHNRNADRIVGPVRVGDCGYNIWMAQWRKRTKRFTSRRAARTWVNQQRLREQRARKAAG